MNNTESVENTSVFLLTVDNKVKYNSLATLDNGINYFNGKFKKVRTYTRSEYIKSGSTPSEIILQKSTYTGDCAIDYHHIKITRESLIDGAVFYQFDQSGPWFDKGVIIPVNPYSLVTTFDFPCISYKTTNNDITDNAYDCIYLWMCTCDKDYNKIVAPCTLDVTIDQYCL